MSKETVNTNLKNIGQSSSHNPGWKGIGEPSLKSLFKQSLKNIKANLFKGNLKYYANYQLQIFANAKTFVLNSGQLKKNCPYCQYKGPGFIATSNEKRISKNSRCPNCDSRSRHRGLYALLEQQLNNENLELLFFAPEKILLNFLHKKKKNITVKTTDYFSHDVNYPKEDIQNLSFTDKSFDYILCNHVIEHVPQDHLAFKELARVLKNNGKAIITIPGDYHLDETVEFKKTDRNGHFRHYGLDVVNKMERYFDTVEMIDMSTISKPQYGVRKNDMAFICHNLLK